MVNLSLSSGTMPDVLKIAELLPALKTPVAGFTNYSNFRPISNLKMGVQSHFKSSGSTVNCLYFDPSPR